jgi:hypothetical protein
MTDLRVLPVYDTNRSRECELAIVGGGFVGTFLAIYLSYHKRFSSKDIVILDPHTAPLSEFRSRVATCGMEVMRSTDTHHLHPDPNDLSRYSEAIGVGQSAFRLFKFRGEEYLRPSVELFFAHADKVIDDFRVLQSWMKGILLHMDCPDSDEGRFALQTTDGEIVARRVIVAAGIGESLHWPDWARSLRERGAPIHHTLDAEFKLQDLNPQSRIAVVGAGLTGSQLALRALREGFRSVSLIGPDRGVQEFDVNPDFLEKKAREKLLSYALPGERLRFLKAGIHPGGVTQEVVDDLRSSSARIGGYRRIDSKVSTGQWDRPTIRLQSREGQLDFDAIILATGWDERPLQHPLLASIKARFNLPSVCDGDYPLLDENLCWTRNGFPDSLYVAGLASQLVIGPAARNFIGARFVGKRLLAAFQ